MLNNNHEPSTNEATFQEAYFQSRFVYDPQRDGIWKAICAYLQSYIPENASVLDIGAGYCSFINHIQAREKYALDLFEGFSQYAHPDVNTFVGSCDNLHMFAANQLDVIFASNLLEHLTRSALDATLAEAARVLKPGGLLILIQPNFRYCYREYFDDYTHIQVFTHVGLGDFLVAHGFGLKTVVPRFLPFSFKSRLPKWAWLARLYLQLPYRPFAKQMLIVSQKPIE